MNAVISTRLVLAVLVVAAVLPLSGIPAQAAVREGITAQPFGPPPDRVWYAAHQDWMARCLPQQDRDARWGRYRQSDRWCADNGRFRSSTPDSRWRRDHPGDAGRSIEGSGNH